MPVDHNNPSSHFDQMKRIHHMVDKWAAQMPDRIVIIDYDAVTFTFSELQAASIEAARCLTSHGVQGGDRMLLIAENSFTAICFILAASRLDCWVVPVNARMSKHELDRVRQHACPSATVFTSQVSTEAARHGEQCGAHEMTGSFGAVHIHASPRSDQEQCHDDPREQVAVLFYTTGTTGDPKGVMLTHGNIMSAGRVSAQVRGCKQHEKLLCVIPVTHVFGFVSIIMASLSVGATMRLMNRFDEAATLQALADGISYFPAVPMMHARIIDYARRNGISKVDAPALKYVSAGGAPLDLDWKQSAEKFYGSTLNNGYGITETSAGVATTLPEKPVKGAGVGPIFPGHEVRIRSTGSNTGSDGDIGEILIRGPSVMKGYYKAPEETAAALDDEGFFHTGDLGQVLPDGTIEVAGRIKELIIRSGFNVYPPEVETALTTHPDVLIAAVIGHPQSDGNEAILAFIEQVPGSVIDEQNLKAHVRDLIAPYKIPTHVFITDDMPRAATGKILKSQLATAYAGLIDSAVL